MAKQEYDLAQLTQLVVFIGGIVSILVGMQVLIAAPLDKRLDGLTARVDQMTVRIDEALARFDETAQKAEALIAGMEDRGREFPIYLLRDTSKVRKGTSLLDLLREFEAEDVPEAAGPREEEGDAP